MKPLELVGETESKNQDLTKSRGERERDSMERVNQTFFLSHGSPTLSIDDSLEARQFFKSWTNKVLPQKPKSILVISAHWDTKVPTVNTVLRNSTIHDFYGFPDPMYKVSLSLSSSFFLPEP